MTYTKRKLSLFLSLILIISMLFTLSTTVSAAPSIQNDTIGGDDSDMYMPDWLKITAYDNGNMGLYFYQPNPAKPDEMAYIQQYFAGQSWGSNLIMTDGSTINRFATFYPYNYNSDVAGIDDYDMGIGTQVKTDNTITTTWTLYGGEIQLKQTISYVPGSFYFSKKFEVSNLGDKTYSDLRFIHGGDTYFGGEDAARAYWNEATRMIYVKNDNVEDFGLMGFYGSAATPADHYFGGDMTTGYSQAAEGRLQDTTDVNYQDAGYQLEWDKAGLEPSETWTITSYEQITWPGDIQILSPGEQAVAPGGTATYEFIVQNFCSAEASLNLMSYSENAWDSSVVEGDTITVPGNGGTKVVHVQVTAPEDAADNDTDIVSLIAYSELDLMLGAIGGTRTIVDDSITSIVSVIPGAMQFLSTDTTLNVTVNTNNIPNGTTVTVELLDSSKHHLDPVISGTGLVTGVSAPTSKATYPGYSGIPKTTVSNSVKGGKSEVDAKPNLLTASQPGHANITLTLPGNLALGTYNLAVTVPGVQGIHNSTIVEAVSEIQETTAETIDVTEITIDETLDETAPAETAAAGTDVESEATVIAEELPQTGEQSPWYPAAFGLSLLVLAGGALIIRRRIKHSDSSQ